MDQIPSYFRGIFLIVIYEHFLVWEEIEGGSSVALLAQSEGGQDLRSDVAQDPLRLLPLITGVRSLLHSY